MNTLRTDIENLPLDGRHVIVGTMKGEVFISRFTPADKWNPAGRWVGMASTDWPVAWAEVPGHPYFPDATRPLLSGERVKP